MFKIFDTFSIITRVFPTIICGLPVLIISFFLIRYAEIKNLAFFLISFKFYGAISLSLIFIYFFSQLLRITSKYFEKKYLLLANGFPSTYLLQYSNDTYSMDFKDLIKKYVFEDFMMNLYAEDESEDNFDNTVKIINEAFKQIVLKVGDGILVKKHNIWYAFFRNLIGGTFYSIIFSIIGIVVGLFIFNDIILTLSSSALLIVFLIFFFFRKVVLIQNAEAYVKQVLAEYVALHHSVN